MTPAEAARMFVPPRDELEAEGDDRTYREAMGVAGRILARRAHTERELSKKLVREGFAPGVVELVVCRLRALELLDDYEFACQWIEDRGLERGYGGDRLIAELESKGVRREVAEAALVEAGHDEEDRATEAAAALFPRVAGRPVPEQGPRLYHLLRRRGFPEEASEAAVRAVLPPQGWD